jgi:hypothetical protein
MRLAVHTDVTTAASVLTALAGNSSRTHSNNSSSANKLDIPPKGAAAVGAQAQL